MDYTKVDVDPPMPTSGEFESLVPQNETILPSPPQPDEADWGDDEVEKVVETEIEDFQSQTLQPTEASHTSDKDFGRIFCRTSNHSAHT